MKLLEMWYCLHILPNMPFIKVKVPQNIFLSCEKPFSDFLYVSQRRRKVWIAETYLLLQFEINFEFCQLDLFLQCRFHSNDN